jgi:hypothetical protein
MLPAWLPPLAVRGGEPIDLALPDAGVVATGCTVGEGADGTEIHGEGLQQVSVHGAFGEVHLELAFAPALTEAVDAAARQVARLVREVPGAVYQVDDTGPDDAHGAWTVRPDVSSFSSRRTATRRPTTSEGGSWTGSRTSCRRAVRPGRSRWRRSRVRYSGETTRWRFTTLLDAIPNAVAEPGTVLALTARVGRAVGARAGS